jgi:hypothetical protein
MEQRASAIEEVPFASLDPAQRNQVYICASTMQSFVQSFMQPRPSQGLEDSLWY